MNTSTSLQIPAQDSPGGPRPASLAVHSSPPPPSSSRRQQRASHTVGAQEPSQHAAASSRDDTPAYTDVYSHPAAMAYAAAHPRRTIPKFGPYLLLQTLGEGEFGKVKLGLHSQWGEEVAVKLIRRGNVDNTVRMSKVEREIEVLRSLKHPNIVRLYDVIETDKYIGIILEYASGGELFDHILAHRYLRERDAAKLFSQLISGVWYIHQKKIVHRDLKLENLLLDRHRNVIITDFGFANRFEHRSDDLMQTSCGSPCYAAPELVISEGLYVGSAVDIWSCGVILYAMLAGYLPFDDDPANPDGDNINLLYKYIVNTPLSFPEYISAEARDLLGMMLVPDPTRRSSLEAVMRHPWLAAYALPRDGAPPATGVAVAFGRSVDQLERAAMEQHQQKRLAYQKQMKAAALAIAPLPAASTPVGRSQSQHINAGSGHRAVATESSAGRSRSTQPEYLYDSSVDLSMSAASPSPPGGSGSPQAKKVHPSPKPGGDDDPFGPPIVPGKPQATPADSAKGHKAGGSGAGSEFRHTIQVEYNEPKGHGARRSDDREEKARRRGSQGPAPNGAGSPAKEPQVSPSTKPLPPSPAPPPATPPVSTTPSAYRGLPTPPSPIVSAPQPPASANSTPTKARSNSRPHTHTPVHATRSTTLPSPGTPGINVDAASPPSTPITAAAPSDEGEQGSRSHRKGRASLDKLGLGKMFGGVPSTPQGDISPGSVNGRVPSESGRSGRSASSVLLSPAANGDRRSASGSERDGEKEREKEKDKDKEGKKSRRNTLTVMVEPFSRTIRNRGAKSRQASTPGGSVEPASAVSSGGKDKGLFKGQPNSAVPPTTTSNGSVSKSSAGTVPSFAGATGEMGEGPGGVGMHASTSKARKVMQWFRTKSKTRDVGIDDEDEKERQGQRSGTPTQAEYTKGHAASSTTLSHSTVAPATGYDKEARLPVQVVVTTPTSATPRTPSSHRESTRPHRTPSSTTAESSSATPSLVTRFRNSVTIGNSHPPSSSAAAKVAAAHAWGALRTHHGAVDQSTITTKAPPEVIRHVRAVLESMGVEIQIESEYKYRCIRAKKRKGSMVVGTTGSLGSIGPAAGNASTTGSLAAVTMVGSAASNGVDKRGLPVPSPSSFSATGGMLRGLLMRRQSSQVSTNGMGSSTTAFDDEAPIVVEPSSFHETAYGDPAQDAGDEVRFSVELTRLDRLNDTFSLDIRRLKGNLRSYKFLYDTIRERADLQR